MNKQVSVKVLSVSRLNDVSIDSTNNNQIYPEQPLNTDFTVKKEPIHVSNDHGKLTQHYDLKCSQTIDKKMNLETFMHSTKQREQQLHHKSLPSSQLRTKKQPKQKHTSLSASRLKEQSPEHTTKEATSDEVYLRRSKRVKLDKTEVGIYEFETIKDFKGNDLIVPKLVGAKSSLSKKNSSVFLKSCQKTPEADSKREESCSPIRAAIKSSSELCEKKEVYELIEPSSGEQVEFCLFSYNCNLEKKQFRPVSKGVTMFMVDEESDDGILCLEAGSFSKTQRHTCGVFYVVRKGMCSFQIGEIMTWHEAGDVIKIPRDIRYKIGNNSDVEKGSVYVHFQFL